MKPRRILLCISAALIISAPFMMCGCEEPSSRPAEVPIPVAQAVPQTTPGGTSVAEPKERQLGGVTITIPAGWQERPANEFILADYRIPAESGEARVTMSSTKGGVEANLDRWRGQFTRQPDD